MQSLINLYNQALTAIGSAPDVTDPNGSGRSVDVLKLWFPVARRAVFVAAHWPSLRVSRRLALLRERPDGADWTNADPAPDFRYAFSLPTDMVQPQYLEDYSRFRLGRIGDERAIFSSNISPILNYTMDDPAPVNWEPGLYHCVLWSLAACVNMAKSGKMEVTQKLERQVTELIAEAGTTAANADDTYFEAVPAFWAGSGYSIPQATTRYYYPTETFRVSMA